MKHNITTKDAIQSVEEQVQWCKDLLLSKNKEYVLGAEPNFCNNFLKAGYLKGESPELALEGMWVKHIVSICDLVKALDRGEKIPYAVWKEKLTDSVNYHFILKMMLDEREGKFPEENDVNPI